MEDNDFVVEAPPPPPPVVGSPTRTVDVVDANHGDDNGWSGLLECIERCTTTFRFWLIGKYNVACAVKCMITFQVLVAARPLDMVEGFVGLS